MEVEEWDQSGESELWRPLAIGVDARPFSLEDGTETVRVEVGEHVRGPRRDRVETRAGCRRESSAVAPSRNA